MNKNSITPPHDLAAERALLGAILIDPNIIDDAALIAGPETFYGENNRLIMQAMVSLSASATPIDIISLSEKLRQMSALERSGGHVYLFDLMGAQAISANYKTYAEIIADKHLKRNLLTVSRYVQSDSMQNELPGKDILEKAESELFSLSQHNAYKDFQPIGQLASDFIDHVERIHHRDYSPNDIMKRILAIY